MQFARRPHVAFVLAPFIDELRALRKQVDALHRLVTLMTPPPSAQPSPAPPRHELN